MEDQTATLRSTVEECIKRIRENIGQASILVGGAAGLVVGSERTTTDIDLLLPSHTHLGDFRQKLLAVEGFRVSDGVLQFQSRQGRKWMDVDLLRTIVLDKTFEDLRDSTF